MPAFNAERYIAVALDSIFAQTRLPAEVIVVDDGSTDGTLAVLAKYAGRIVVISQPNLGVSAAANRGVAASTGDLLAFLDADDLWLPTKLELQTAFLESRPDTDAVFGYIQQFVSEDLTPEEAQRVLCPKEPQPGVVKTVMMIRRQAFDRIGNFAEYFRYIDLFEWYSRAIDGDLRIHMLPDLLALRRLHTANTGVRSRASQQSEYLIALKLALDRRRNKQSGYR